MELCAYLRPDEAVERPSNCPGRRFGRRPPRPHQADRETTETSIGLFLLGLSDRPILKAWMSSIRKKTK